jgi:cation transport regulator ChaB
MLYDEKNLPDYIKKLSKKMRKLWTNVWNSAFKKYKDEKKALKMANAAIKTMKAEGSLFEIQSGLGSVKPIKDLSAEDFESYGVNASLASYRPNYKIIEGKLFASDLPFRPHSDRVTEGYHFLLSKDTVEKSLWQLNNMPVHVNADLSDHSDKEGEEKKYSSVGTILGAKMVETDGENWVHVLCALWEADYPEQVASISENKDKLGMSIEMFFDPETIEAVDYNLLKVNDVSHKGLAILQKEKAAFPQTQLLVASGFQVDKSVYNIGGAEEMDLKIISDGTVEGTKLEVGGKEVKNLASMNFSLYGIDEIPYFNYSLIEQEKDGFVLQKNYRLSAAGLEEVKTGQVETDSVDKNTEPDKEKPPANTQGGETNMAEYKGLELSKETYTQEEVLGLFKSLEETDEQKKTLEAKDAEIKELKDKIEARKAEDEKLEAKKKEDEKIQAEQDAVVEAGKWFEENKDSYLPDNKDEVIDIRAKIELGTATKEEILKIAELKKQSGNLSASANDPADEAKKIDNLFGIKSARVKK